MQTPGVALGSLPSWLSALTPVAVLASAKWDPPGSTCRTALFVEGSFLPFCGSCQTISIFQLSPSCQAPDIHTGKNQEPFLTMPHSASMPLCVHTQSSWAHSPEHRLCTATTCTGSAVGLSSPSSLQMLGCRRWSFAESNDFT